MRYEIATLTIRFGTLGAVNAGVEAWTSDPASKGTLLGAWFTEIGELNQYIVLRSFADDAEMQAERYRALASTNPFNAGEAISALTFDSYAPFPWMGAVQPGAYGGVYEIRTYKLKHGGVPPTIEAWKSAMVERGKLSPLTVVMYALDGSPRFTHIWPFKDVNERTAIRAESVRLGIWPPKGGPEWLTGEMRSTIAVPTAISPLK